MIMKRFKIWSIMMLMVMISPLMANAQQVEINELDLVGTWELISYEGEFNYIPNSSQNWVAKPDYITLYSDVKNQREFGYAYTPGSGSTPLSLMDYFITSNNPYILHIIGSGASNPRLRYRILDYKNDELELATFDGKGKLKYRRGTEPTSVSSNKIIKNNNADKEYSLQGYSIGNTAQKGIKIVTSQDGTTRKVIK